MNDIDLLAGQIFKLCKIFTKLANMKQIPAQFILDPGYPQDSRDIGKFKIKQGRIVHRSGIKNIK